jgi:hypothetical protein
MPNIFDMLYSEFCRARLAEMRKQLLLWPRPPVVSEENCEGSHPGDAADDDIGLDKSAGRFGAEGVTRHPRS